MRLILALCAVLLLVTALPCTAAAQTCHPGLIAQGDLAGTYVSQESLMRLTIYPCGGSHLLWSNTYGTHEAVYVTSERLPDGGLVSALYQPDPVVGSLDGRNTIGVKPAEPGYLQLVTIGPFLDNPRVYRLRKML